MGSRRLQCTLAAVAVRTHGHVSGLRCAVGAPGEASVRWAHRGSHIPPCQSDPCPFFGFFFPRPWCAWRVQPGRQEVGPTPQRPFLTGTFFSLQFSIQRPQPLPAEPLA